jgi:CubicO group peptidase (beta-lactamase class C family)
MRRFSLFFVVVLVLIVGCGGGDVETAVNPTAVPPSPTDTPIPPTPEPEPTAVPPTDTPIPATEEPETETPDLAALEEAFQAIVDTHVEAGFPGVVLMVDAPDIGFTFQGAGGMVDDAVPMTPDTSFRLASISKMMLATLMLRLAEEGMLDLDDPISQYLDTAVTDLLNGPDGEPYGEMITIRQLLSHTSGVADYFSPTHVDNTAPEFDDIYLSDPDKVWEPVEAIAFSTENVNPQFPPGESWDYSNTNFILAGLIVEEVTGMSLGDAYEEWLFAPLGMANTFFALIDDSRLENVAHVYRDDTNLSDYASLSWGWGSCGVVSTANDLNQFLWAWVNDEIFTDPASKEAMTQWTSMSSVGFDGLYYGLGIIDIDFGAMGSPEIDEIIGHNGMWNSFVYYWPKENLTIIGTLNQANPMDAYTGPVGMTMQTVLMHVEAE